MSEISPDTGQAQRDIAAGSARCSGRERMPARKVLEERAANRQLQKRMHAIEARQASSGISVEVNAVNGPIVALSQQIVQLTIELTATKEELIATKNEFIATKNGMTI